jgi:hypothetical protein
MVMIMLSWLMFVFFFISLVGFIFGIMYLILDNINKNEQRSVFVRALIGIFLNFIVLGFFLLIIYDNIIIWLLLI